MPRSPCADHARTMRSGDGATVCLDCGTWYTVPATLTVSVTFPNIPANRDALAGFLERAGATAYEGGSRDATPSSPATRE